MKVILASQSPRRKFILTQMGLDFQAIVSNFEEYFDDNRPVKEVAEELGLGKAMDVAKKHPDSVVIGSDTIVVLDGKQLGKPENEQEAKDMLRAYSDRSHQIITSVAVICLDKGYQRVGSDISEIFVDVLSEDFISKYVATGTTYDKGGGYAIQHPIMRPHIRKVIGRLDTIIGLPTNLVAEFLKDFDINVELLDLEDKELIESEGFYK